MSGDEFSTTPGPLHVELHRIFLGAADNLRVELRHGDESWLMLDFEPESDGFHQILGTLTRVATQTLSDLGGRGVVIVGTTPDDGEGS